MATSRPGGQTQSPVATIPASHQADRILIIRLSHLGDIVHTLPLLSALREAYPESHIGWLVEDSLAPFLFKLTALTEPIVLPRERMRASRSVRECLPLARRLRSRRFQVTIDVHGLTKSSIWGLVAGSPRRIGFAGENGRELSRWLNNTLVQPRPEAHHVVNRNLALLEPLGVFAPSVRFEMPIFNQAAEGISIWLQETCGSHRPCLISPGAGWETKRWPAEMYGALAASLANEINRPVIVLWGAGEEHLRDTVLAVSHSNLVFPAPRTDLAQMTELIRRSGLLVTNDTGPLHLAVALGVPTVSIFGPSDPRRNGPYYSSGHRVVRADVPCLECWKTVCPAQDTLCCMRGVTVESVLSAALEVLS